MSKQGSILSIIRGRSMNYYILLIRGTISSFLGRLVMDFNNLYITELGATALQLSTIRAIGSAFEALVSIPAGWISDVYGAKRILLFGMIIQMLSIASYALAQSWEWIFIAIIFASLNMTLIFRVENILVINSLSTSERGIGYGVRIAIIQAFSLIAPATGGIIIYYSGGISVESIRPLYFIQLVGYAILTTFTAFKLEGIQDKKELSISDFVGQYKEILDMGSGIKRFVFIQALGSITWGMAMPFPMVYVAEFKNANSLTIGYMGTCFILASMIMALPLGSIADKKGRKIAIFITRPFFYASHILLVFSPKDIAWPLLLAWFMRGVMMGSRAWMTMSMEMVPREYRGRWTGLTSLVQSITRSPAMIIGGYIYQNINPTYIFIFPIFVDLLIRMPILATIPETLRKGKNLK